MSIVLVCSSQRASAPAGGWASTMRIPKLAAWRYGSYVFTVEVMSELVIVRWLCAVVVFGDDLIGGVRGEAVAGLGCGFGSRENLSSQLSISKGSGHLF